MVKIKPDLSMGKNILRFIRVFAPQIGPAFWGWWIVTLLPTFLGFLRLYFTGQFVGQIINTINNPQNINLVWYYFALTLVTDTIITLIWRLNAYLDRVVFYNFQEVSNLTILRHRSKLSLEQIEDKVTAQLYTKLESEGYTFKPWNHYSGLVWQSESLVRVILGLFFILKVSPILTLVLLATTIPQLIVEVKSSKLKWGLWDKEGDEKHMYSSGLHAISSSDFMKEIRIFNLFPEIYNKVLSLFHQFKESQMKVVNRMFVFNLLSAISEIVGRGGAEVYLLLKLFAGNYTYANYNFYNGAINQFGEGLRNSFATIARFYTTDLFMRDYFKYLDIQPTLVGGKIKTNSALAPKIEFKNVSFKYPHSKNWVFKNLNLTIPSGQDIALVGENGAGKTTFVKLLCRFYDPTYGQILINGKDLKKLDLANYYRQIGVLFQDFNHYSFTLKENIWYGDTRKSFQSKEIGKAILQASVKKFMDKYEKKENTMLAKVYDHGVEPSGGQWQRIALARAFFRNANILILDEPTAAVDAKAEYEIFAKIAKLQKQKTTIIISHRFSTVRNADKIYVFDKGQVVESGSHQELLNIPQGQYKQMFELQAKGYK